MTAVTRGERRRYSSGVRHLIRVERRIPHPPASVRAVLADLPAWPRWNPNIREMRNRGADPADPWRPGSRWRENVGRACGRASFDLTTVDAGPDGVGWEARYLGVRGRHIWRVGPWGEGTLVVSEETFEGPALLVVPARGLFRLFGVRTMTVVSLAALEERVVECAAPPDTGAIA